MFVAKTFRHQHLDSLTDQCLSGIAEQLFRLGVDQRDLAFAVDKNDGTRRRLDDASKSFLSPFALGDVDDAGQNQEAVLGLDRVETNLDGKLMAVFLQSVEIPAHPHGP